MRFITFTDDQNIVVIVTKARTLVGLGLLEYWHIYGFKNVFLLKKNIGEVLSIPWASAESPTKCHFAIFEAINDNISKAHAEPKSGLMRL